MGEFNSSVDIGEHMEQTVAYDSHAPAKTHKIDTGRVQWGGR